MFTLHLKVDLFTGREVDPLKRETDPSGPVVSSDLHDSSNRREGRDFRLKLVTDFPQPQTFSVAGVDGPPPLRLHVRRTKESKGPLTRTSGRRLRHTITWEVTERRERKKEGRRGRSRKTLGKGLLYGTELIII